METVLCAVIAGLAAVAVAIIETRAARRRKEDDERHELLMRLERERSARDDAIALGMKALLRSSIVNFYDKYHNQGKSLTVERKRELDEMYSAYHALGGNGTITGMYRELEDSDIWIAR